MLPPATVQGTARGGLLTHEVPVSVSTFPGALGATAVRVPPLPTNRLPAWTEVSPVPPWATDRGVSSPDRLLMSLFAPEAAAPRLVRAPASVLDPVPPLATFRVPPRVRLPLVVTGEPEVRPVLPGSRPTLVTVPVVLLVPKGPTQLGEAAVPAL